MPETKEVIYPVTKETMHAYAKSIFDPIMRGDCVTTVWVPMAGRRKFNRFIMENIEVFKDELPNYNKYLLVYVEPLDLTEESLSGYLRLMGRSFIEAVKGNKLAGEKVSEDDFNLFTNENSTYPILLEELRRLLVKVSDGGLEIVFFLGEFDELSFVTKIFFNNLKSLWTRLYPRLHYVFLMINVVEDQELIYKWDELSEAILQNIVYVPIRRNNDIDYIVRMFCDNYDVNAKDEFLEVIKEVCGGHPYTIMVAVRLLRDNKPHTTKEFKNNLLENYELRSISSGIFDRRSHSEKEAFIKIIQKRDLAIEEKRALEFLIKLALVISKEEEYEPFSLLFKDTIERVANVQHTRGAKGTLSLDEKTGAILLDGKTVEESFTRQEYSILTLFLKRPQEVLTRDDIGAVLWGESSYEKYSDWAIDQLMSKLRKKLKHIGVDVEIFTLRGRGYKFTQNPVN